MRSHIKLLNLVRLLGVVLIAMFMAASAEGQTASTTVSLPASADTYLSENSPSNNYGTQTTLVVDGDDPPGSGRDKRTHIKFDLSKVPSGAKIQSAKLKFNVENQSANTYSTHYLKRNWSETGANWSTYDGVNAWGSAGASSSTYDRGGTDLAPFKASATGAVSVPMNSAGIAKVQEWVDGKVPNYGLMIWNSSNTDRLALSSRESANKPVLEVTYSRTDPDMTGWTSLEKYNYHERIKPMRTWLAGDTAYIGEANTPRGTKFGDTTEWNALLEKMLVELDKDKHAISAFSVDERQRWGGYPLNSYSSGSDGGTNLAIDTPAQQAPVWEKHLSAAAGGATRGYNAAAGTGALEIGQYAGSPGTYGEYKDYHYAGNHVSPTTGMDTFQYLKRRGYDNVRIGFKWERVQPVLGGPLDAAEMQRLRTSVNDAGAAGLKVIIEPHNYAYWKFKDGEALAPAAYYRMGDGNLKPEHFYDLWKRLSTEFKANPSAYAYDLMNEPGVQGSIPLNGYPSQAKAWEAYAQGALDAIRANGDNKLVYVPTWRNSPGDVGNYHPDGKWIKDPANNYQYAFHLYFWIDGWGNYTKSYADENAAAASRGY